MRRFWILALCLCLLICCGCSEEAKPADTGSAPATEATDDVTVPSTTQEVEEPQVYRNPLNGQILEEPYQGRVVAVVINNIQDALPHHGVSGADIFYEAETEGGITRCLAIFSNPEQIGTIGPVRSVRTFFNSLALSHDAAIFYCGGSVRGRAGYAAIDGEKIENWMEVDQRFNDPYFFRDEQRYNSGYAWEHTLFTSGEKLQRAVTAKGFDSASLISQPMDFAQQVTLEGESHSELVVNFADGKTSSFTYDTEDQFYYMEQYGSPYIDANNGEQIAFRNVIVLNTKQSYKNDGEYIRSYYDLVGEGEGILAIGGKNVAIHWSRDNLLDSIVYTMEDGSLVTFAEGNTYVAIVGDKAEPVTIS
jgi:hypothetical protein